MKPLVRPRHADTLLREQLVDAIRHCLGLEALYCRDAPTSYMPIYPERCLRITTTAESAARGLPVPVHEQTRRSILLHQRRHARKSTAP